MQDENALSPRLEGLKAQLVATIPCEPDTAEGKRELEAMPLVRLMAHYMNWVDRLIAPRPRKVTFAQGFFPQKVTDEQLVAIRQWVSKSEAGEDLSLYLSAYSRTHGYSPRSPDRKGIKWADGRKGDKDYALNTMGTHHFHLVPSEPDGRRPGGSRALIYAQVRRDSIRAVLLGDHNSFNDGSLRSAVAAANLEAGIVLHGLTPPRNDDEFSLKDRMLLARRGFTTTETVAGSVVPMGFGAMDGSAMDHVRHADRARDLIEQWDSRLETPEGIADLRRRIPAMGLPVNNLQWGFHYGDFGLYLSDTVFLSFLSWKR